ncbi:MAG: DUF3168 domain-containing protein [Sphingosinicella sp.]|nr:DUF3168 domain-containing protein [Sphingosinicella sp.]
MSDAGLALQEALYAALGGFAGSLVTGVYDGPPAGAVPPYLTIGPDLVTDISTKTERRRQHLYAVTAWAAGDAVSVLKPVLAVVETAVLGIAALEGHRLVTNDMLRSRTAADPARGLVSGTIEFRARTETL